MPSAFFSRTQTPPSGRYKVPWRREQIHICNSPHDLAKLAKTSFTRASLIRGMLERFGLSQNSVVSSTDDYARKIKPVLIKHMPDPATVQGMAARIVAALEQAPGDDRRSGVATTNVLIAAIYLELLEHLLGVQPLQPLKDFVLAHLDFKRIRNSLPTQALVYSFEIPGFKTIHKWLDRFIFPELHQWRKTAPILHEQIRDFSIPLDGGLYSDLMDLHQKGEISTAQFKGEIASILDAAHSLASSSAALLLCAASRPEIAENCADPAAAHNFVAEVLRLYPPFRIFGYQNHANKGVSTEVILVDLYGLHRHPDYWTSPHEFDPSRFDNTAGGGGLKYIPFGVGKRACPGRSFSISLMKNILQILRQNEVYLTLPNDYQTNSFGLPIHRKTIGHLFSVVDDRLVIQTQNERAQEREERRSRARVAVGEKISHIREAIAGGLDIWILEKQVQHAMAHLAAPQDRAEARPVHPMLMNLAHLNGVSVDDAARSVIEQAKDIESMMLWSEMVKSHYLHSITNCDDLNSLSMLEHEIQSLNLQTLCEHNI